MHDGGFDFRLLAAMMTDLRARGGVWVERPGRYVVLVFGGTVAVLVLYVVLTLIARA